MSIPEATESLITKDLDFKYYIIVFFALNLVNVLIYVGKDLYSVYRSKRLTYSTKKIDVRDEQTLLKVYNPLYKKYYKFNGLMRFPVDKIDDLHKDLEKAIKKNFDVLTPELYGLHVKLEKQMANDYKESKIRNFCTNHNFIHVQADKQKTAKLILRVIIAESTMLRKKLHYPYASKNIAKFVKRYEIVEALLALAGFLCVIIFPLASLYNEYPFWNIAFALLGFVDLILVCFMMYYRFRTRHTGIY